jgi:hypothetical protein
MMVLPPNQEADIMGHDPFDDIELAITHATPRSHSRDPFDEVELAVTHAPTKSPARDDLDPFFV